MVAMHANRCSAPCLALLAALSLVGCGGAHARYEHHIERGKRYLADGNLSKAGIEFRNAIQIQPKDAQALYLFGRVAELEGNVRQAVGFYEGAIDSQPDFESARASLAKILVLGGAVPQALEVIGPGLAKHPNNADLLAARAVAHHHLKEDASARADAEQAVRLSPTNENAVGVLAALYGESGDFPHAIECVEEAVRRLPDSIQLREVLVSLYQRTGQTEKAAEQLQAMIRLRPRELKPRVELALYYARGHELDAAQQTLEHAVQDLPSNDAAKLTLANFIGSQRSHADGEKLLRSYVASQPDDLELQFGLATYLQQTGAVEQARTVYQEIIRRDGSGSRGLVARKRIATMAVAQRKYADATKLISEVLQKAPRDADALFLRANIALALDDPSGAIADLRAVVRDQPRSVPVQRALANAYLATEQPGLAEEALRAAADADPGDAALKIELARLLTQTGRGEQAITLLSDSVKQTPDNSELRAALISAYLAKSDLRQASEAADAFKAQEPNAWQSYQLAGLVAQRQNHLDEAATDFEHALQLQPGSAGVLGSLSQVDHQRGNDARAIARIQAAIERDPRNFALSELLGQFYFMTGDASRAAQTFEHLKKLDPGQWRGYVDLARVKLAARDISGATSDYEAAAKLAPHESQVVIALAGLYEQQGRIDAAIARYQSLYESSPRMRQVAANNLAMLLATYKSDQASLDRARDLTAGFAASDNSSLLDTHGWVRYKRHEFQDAVTVLERAVERSPESKVIRYHLGMAELGLGRRERARTDLENALSGAATFSGADEARTTLASLKSDG